jgi:hypothetical protein
VATLLTDAGSLLTEFGPLVGIVLTLGVGYGFIRRVLGASKRV